MGEKAATNDVVTALMNAMRDEDKYVRWAASEALGKMGEKATTNEVITALLNAMHDEHKYVRKVVSEALGKMGEKAATNEVITALVNAMRDEHYDVRWVASEAFGNLVEKAATNEVINTLANAMHDEHNNAEVDACNTKVLASLNTEGAIANAYDFCVGHGLASIREKVLNNVKNLKTTETYGLPLKIDLKVGAKYMMTVNIDTEDGLVNGACGKLIMIDYGKLQKTNETVPCRIWIKFNEEKTGRKARVNFQNVMRNRNIDLSLTPIEPVTRQINTKSTNFKVERKQFPLVPCEAITIYKSQGGTYEKVVVNLKEGMTRSELYVGSSRATTANGLYLIGDFVPPKPPESNDAVAMMFKTMRSERMIKFSLEFPEESQGERFYVMFHNVQSLNKHFLDIKSDKAFLFASMISLVETWTKPDDSLEIEGFKIV
ncbi:unnamed protein product [Rotaria sp. Silwood1]|nr:unnamed protein product [Rotaria sp. Silwood1]